MRPPLVPYSLAPGLYAVSATLLDEVYSPFRGPWSNRWEQRYQALRRNVSRRTATPDDYQYYDHLRFARLCKYLQTRPPEGHPGYSILIFRLTAAELQASINGRFPLSSPIGPGRMGAPAQSFAIGEAVRVKNQFVSGHVRMPGYIRGKSGIVVSKSIPFPFPDAAAHGMHEAEEPTYDVRFRSPDLWPDASDEAFIHAAVFQSYLEQP